MLNVPAIPCPCCGQLVARQSVGEVIRDVRLPPIQKRMLEVLAASMGQLIPADRLVDVAYGDDPEGGPLDARNCVASHIKRLKPKIAAYGLAIEGKQNGSGRRLVWAQSEGMAQG